VQYDIGTGCGFTGLTFTHCHLNGRENTIFTFKADTVEGLPTIVHAISQYDRATRNAAIGMIGRYFYPAKVIFVFYNMLKKEETDYPSYKIDNAHTCRDFLLP
jgi:hypothetical protein